MSETLEIARIRRDSGTQPRANLNPTTVAEYAEALQGGAEFPPVGVFYDGQEYHLFDGFHRVAAHEMVGRAHIEADVRQGTARDAVLHSAGTNATHGLRRTNDDKRRAVVRLLSDPEWSQWSDRRIAEWCFVSNRFASDLRREMASVNGTQMPSERKVTRGGSTYTMDTGNIGRTTPSEAFPASKFLRGWFYVFDKKLMMAINTPFASAGAARTVYPEAARFIVTPGEHSMNDSYTLVSPEDWSQANDEYMKRGAPDPDQAARKQFDPTMWYAFDHKLRLAIFFPYISQLTAQSNYPDQERYTVAKGHYFAQHSNYRVISRHGHDKIIKQMERVGNEVASPAITTDDVYPGNTDVEDEPDGAEMPFSEAEEGKQNSVPAWYPDAVPAWFGELERSQIIELAEMLQGLSDALADENYEDLDQAKWEIVQQAWAYIAPEGV